MSTSNDVVRQAGILLHPTSLPSGHIDTDAIAWLDWLHQAGIRVWQMLPLNDTGRGRSPYQSQSAFALEATHLSEIPSQSQHREMWAQFKNFQEKQHFWLIDYARFVLIKEQHQGQPWYQWPDPYRNRNLYVLAQFDKNNAEHIERICWEQFYLAHQWKKKRQQANGRNIKLFGDLPVFVAYDSADVWAQPEVFLLDSNRNPIYVTGVPPDYFSKTGQRWGSPHYNWDYMQQTNFGWWLSRLRYLADFFDIVRIDHFRGLHTAWCIKPDSPTAIEGFWMKAKGAELLQVLTQSECKLELVAEDLGIITNEVRELRQHFNLPGISVLQFGFEGGDDNPHHPDNITSDQVVYTGTHDNDTLKGWYRSLDDNKRHIILGYLQTSDEQSTIQRIKQIALESKAQLAIFPLQDVLELDTDARMNVPGTTENNWLWRFDWGQIPSDLASNLHQQLEQTQRL